ncbi:MAG: hypothetical protein MK110_01600 [Fuerstiella sp.]|nr:hypothetical protein [Fuerstiella sp.]
MTVHTIRLAGPWEQQTAGTDAVRIVLPCSVSTDRPPAALIRKFHQPGGLTDRSKVHIVITVDTTLFDATVNGQSVPAADCRQSGSWFEISLEITTVLKPFNTLSIRSHKDRKLTLQSAVMRIQDDG